MLSILEDESVLHMLILDTLGTAAIVYLILNHVHATRFELSILVGMLTPYLELSFIAKKIYDLSHLHIILIY